MLLHTGAESWDNAAHTMLHPSAVQTFKERRSSWTWTDNNNIHKKCGIDIIKVVSLY